MLDSRPPFQSFVDALGQAATVTPPGEPSVITSAIWLPPVTVEMPTGSDFRRAESKRVLALPLAGLPDVPRGTVVTTAEFPGVAASDWSVDEAERIDFDHWRVLVIPVVP